MRIGWSRSRGLLYRRNKLGFVVVMCRAMGFTASWVGSGKRVREVYIMA